MSQQRGRFPEECPAPLVGLPTPIDPAQRAIYVASPHSRAMRPIDIITAVLTPRRVIITVALAVLSLLVIRGIEIRISEIVIHLGR